MKSSEITASKRNAGSVESASLYTPVGKTLAPLSIAPCHPRSNSFPVRGSDTAPKRASKAFIKPIAVAAKIGVLISRIMVKHSKKALMLNPKPNIIKVSIGRGRGGISIINDEKIKERIVPSIITTFLLPIVSEIHPKRGAPKAKPMKITET